MDDRQSFSDFELRCEELIDLIRESIPNQGWDSGRSFDLTTSQCIAEIIKFMNRTEVVVANLYGYPTAIITADKIDDFKEWCWNEEGNDDEDPELGELSREDWIENNISFETFTLNKFE